MRRSLFAAAVVACAAAVAGCPTEPEVITGIANLPGGNPLVPRAAMYPYPSDFYTVPADTRTGLRVSIPDGVPPEGLPASMWADHDGFSRIPAILARFDAELDASTLPSPGLPDDASVLLLEPAGDGWARVPVLVELDLGAFSPLDQALIVRPERALAAATPHVVLILDTLRSADGAAIPPSDAFRALRDGIATDSDAVESMRGQFEHVNDAIADLGIAPESVVLGWRFTTRSEEQVTAPLLAMQGVMEAAPLDAWSIDSDEEDGARRVIEGTFTAPNFLDEDTRIRVDGETPIQEGTREVAFVLSIPSSVEGPRPTICYGHGFFSTKEEILRGSLAAGLERWEMSAIAIDFVGFSEHELAETGVVLGGNLDRSPTIMDRQVQNVATFTALARLVEEELAPEIDALDGTVHYMGISNGGTQGATIMSTSPRLQRGVLVVPGGGWTHMLQRAVQWNEFAAPIEEMFPRALDLQLTMALLQPIFDPADSLNYAGRLLRDRFPGVPAKDVTLHEAVGDAQVANLVTHWLAATMDVPLVVPSPLDIPALRTVEAPPGASTATSGLFVYDEDLPPPPAGNVPPPDDNGAHGSIRDLEAYKAQVGAFLEDGTVEQVCDGPCDPD